MKYCNVCGERIFNNVCLYHCKPAAVIVGQCSDESPLPPAPVEKLTSSSTGLPVGVPAQVHSQAQILLSETVAEVLEEEDIKTMLKKYVRKHIRRKIRSGSI